MKAVRIQVYGRVQGVFYRASTKTTADNLGLNGWVKNETDGSVLIHAEGFEAKLKQLEDWCREGPQFSKVISLETAEVEIAGFRSFEVRY